MKIVDVRVDTFRYRSKTVRDSEGHSHPGEEHWATNNMLTVATDQGAEGHFFGPATQELIEALVKPALVGEDPFFREMLWQRLLRIQKLNRPLHETVVAQVDCALWDLAGRHLGIPVYKMMGAARTKVEAYASIMPGDEIPGGLSTPEEYGRFSEQLVAQGYNAIKLHTWMSPIPWAPDVKKDVAACAAVREAVGPDVTLMLDPHHFYDRHDALDLAREIEKLGFLWIEEPMNEHSMSSYVWLNSKLDMAVLGPESVEGSLLTRAEWVRSGASDMLRGGVGEVNGITPIMKLVHLAEAFGMRMEVHDGNAANMHVLCAMGINGRYYERGMVHPMLDHETPPPWHKTLYDPMDSDGFVHVPERPGLGEDIDFDFVREHTIRPDEASLASWSSR